MMKRMILMILVVGLLFGGIVAYKNYQGKMMRKFMGAGMAPPATVTAQPVATTSWQPQLSAIGTVRSVRGIDVTTEISGIVAEIPVASGESVKSGQPLLHIDDETEQAQLAALEAEAALAESEYARAKKQFDARAVSQADVEQAEAHLKILQADIRQQQAILKKKTICAPFAGRIGISTINPGQYLIAGEKIFTLQALDQVYIDFTAAQHVVASLSTGQTVTATSDAYPQVRFKGKIIAIDAVLRSATRTVQVQAQFDNPREELLPGMYATVTVELADPVPLLTLPQTAVSYNPYGETVYRLEATESTLSGNQIYSAQQTFITLGQTRGDQVAVSAGLNAGDLVVTSGQLKLHNGSRAIIDNTVEPSNDPAPLPQER